MKRFGASCFGKVDGAIASCVILLLLIASAHDAYSQSRIHYAGKDIFINGINIAWVNFAGDIGPNAPNLTQFQTEFKTVHDNGGNVMRFWLHTNGSQTPLFDGNGYVSGPGPVAVKNLKQILNLAQENDIGLILCLWSHDMLNQSELDTTQLHRNAKLLTDTAYTNTYIRKALIPMVDSLKGHPAIAAWEIFNEPEGITVEFGWSGRDRVPMQSIQRCVNLMTGAIHREDPGALVTSGAVTFQTLTDVSPSAPSVGGLNTSISSLSTDEQQSLAQAFNARHRLNLTTDEYVKYVEKNSAATNLNYYRDDRLKAVGGDSLGTLDFYCVHYYAQGASLSPFVHPASFWGLTKPIVAAEFYMQATDGLTDLHLYPWLYDNGYAGGMAWSWTDFGNPSTNSKADTWLSLKYMFANHRNDIIINPKTGSIYVFSANQTVIQKTDSTRVKWDIEPGSVAKLDGQSISAVKDSMVVAPLVTTAYTLIATGQINDTAIVVVTVLPTGKIMTFKAVPPQIGTGESVSLTWQVVKGSSATLNGDNVPVVDTRVVYPTLASNVFTLIGQGDVRDSITITIPVQSPDQVDRALGAGVTVSSNDTVAYSFSNPNNIVDGNNFSRWQASSSTSQWVKLDLGISYSISQIVIRWGNKAYAKQYSVQASSNDSSWQVLKSTVGGTGGTNYVETLSDLHGSGSYVYFLLQAQGNGAYSIAEISIYGTVFTGVEAMSELPTMYSLSQNYPNPFNPSTTINFSLIKASDVKLTLFNVLGQKVATLVDNRMNAGVYSVQFNAKDLSSGVYFYRIEAGDFRSNKKMLLLK